MNMHITPTQAALHQAHKERQARLWGKNSVGELVKRQDEINRLKAEIASLHEQLSTARNEVVQRRTTQLLDEQRRKNAWRRSWQTMVNLAKWVDADDRRAINLVLRAEREKELGEKAPKRKSCADICKEVAEKYGVTETEIRSERRNHYLKQPRMEAYYRAATETVLSLPQIGRAMGGRDHTTVLYGKRRYYAWMQAKAKGETTIKSFPSVRMDLILDIAE